MKWIFAILLVINILFFAVMRLAGSHGTDSQQGHEPVKAEKIKLLAEPYKKIGVNGKIGRSGKRGQAQCLPGMGSFFRKRGEACGAGAGKTAARQQTDTA